METLPTELQELVCSHLDGDTLLRACCVNTQWNSIISSLQSVWHYLCLRMGTGPLNYAADNWKTHYLNCRQFLRCLEQGSAFRHRNFIPENFRGSAIRGFVYSDGRLIAGIHNHVRIWQVTDLQSVAMFRVPYKLSCLAVSQDGQVLGIGCHNGAITTWRLNCEKIISAELLAEYLRHAGNITALHISTEHSLLCSGSTDRTARVWDLYSGAHLWSVTMDSSVCQITVLPHKYMLFVADEVSIRQFRWLKQDVRMEATGPSISTGASMHRFLIHDRSLVSVKDRTVVVLDWCTGMTLHQLALECTDIDLVAVGTRFMLAALWDTPRRKQELAIIDISSGNAVGSYPLPYCRPVHIVVGETAWLSGLTDWKPCTLVTAVSNTIQATDCFYVVTWR